MNSSSLPTEVRVYRRSASRSPSRDKSRRDTGRREPSRDRGGGGKRSPSPRRRFSDGAAPAPAAAAPEQPLPEGWYTAHDERGRAYYYTANGQTTWTRPGA